MGMALGRAGPKELLKSEQSFHGSSENVQSGAGRCG